MSLMNEDSFQSNNYNSNQSKSNMHSYAAVLKSSKGPKSKSKANDTEEVKIEEIKENTKTMYIIPTYRV